MNNTQALLLNSMTQIAQNKPIDKITVREIADYSGVTTQTFYNYFSDKYELVFWAYKNRLDVLFEMYRKSEIDWKGLLNLYLVGYRENADFIQNAFTNTPSGNDSYVVMSSQYFADSIIKYLEEKNGVAKLPKEIMMLVRMYSCGVINAVAYWLFNDTQMTKDDMTKVMNESVPAILKNGYKLR